MHRRALTGALVAALALAGVACSDDDEDDTAETGSDTTEAPAEGEESEGEVVEITAVEYAYENVPESVAAGTRLSLVNGGEEPHELVAFLIPEDEDRSVEELTALSDDELAEVFGGEPEPVTVILAASGQTDTPGPVVGDGTLSEAGRYGIVCFLPVGATDELLESEGPPEDSEAPPHVSQGMAAELVVE